MNDWLVALIVFGVLIGIAIVIGIPIIIYLKWGDWKADRKSKKFEKKYPHIYKIYSDYWDKRELLELKRKQLNEEYKSNCDKISEIDNLLPNIPVESDRHIFNTITKNALKENNLNILTAKEDIEKELKKIHTREYEIVETFYRDYIGQYGEDLKY